MVRTTPPSHDPHEHEFEPEPNNRYVEFDGKWVYVSEQCVHEEVLNTVDSPKRGETYYVTGERCDAKRKTTFEITVTTAFTNTDHSSNVVTQDSDYETWENVVVSIEDELEEQLKLDPDTGHVIETEHDGIEYRVSVEKDSQKIRE